VSSTGRGERLGGEHDNFETPAWCVRRLLEAVTLPAGTWVEPGAGNGAIIKAVNSCARTLMWQAIEIRPECQGALLATGADVVTIGDFLTTGVDPSASVVIGNPPFALAERFIERAFELCPRAVVVFLLRLNFAAGEKRQAFMERTRPSVYVLPNRPPFTRNAAGKFATDSTEYAWFVWPPSRIRGSSWGWFRVLASTPAEERGVRPVRKRKAMVAP